jgi:hypothetical protein
MAAQARVDLTTRDAAPDDAYVRADRQRLSQVLLNLLSNAIKYNRRGRPCRRAVGAVEAVEGNDVAASARPREDTGRGIPAERQAELFTPFARLGAENSEVEGTGLGLALSQRLPKRWAATSTRASDASGSVIRYRPGADAEPARSVEENGSAVHREARCRAPGDAALHRGQPGQPQPGRDRSCGSGRTGGRSLRCRDRSASNSRASTCPT